MQAQRHIGGQSPRRMPPPAVAALQTSIVRLFGQSVLPLLARSRTDVHASKVASLAESAARGDAGALRAAIDRLIRDGVKAEQICQTYLTDVARRLGDLWVEDRCSFIEVTLGAILLQNELHRIAPRLFQSDAEGLGRSALMLTAPGDRHSLGIRMLAEFFRAGGWLVEELSDSDDAAGRLAATEFGMVAITVADTTAALDLAPFIARLRAASRQPRLVVMVGGSAINAQPSLLPMLGADATAPDAASALQRAEALVGMMRASR